ncbi:10143_t:CDS:1 [Funneliformis geosporum]|uniref:16329_t:CDS:1 n=1 Tax=Funneliformis geosporum TaxID=1117311 RepID=A0A9W4WRC9_9GLOM|nr:16329_t:CDS:1 [Funneliformis geosporum]CAI2167688.1 10143_t:CDS:1 [Funneliformis geosporum]
MSELTEIENGSIAESSSLNTKSTKSSIPYERSIRTASLFTESTRASSQNTEYDKYDEPFNLNSEQRKRENAFLGYYECLNSGNSKLNIPTMSISTARIDLHEVISRKQVMKEGRHLILAKIKESPQIKNVSLFIITGKGRKRHGEFSGKKFNQFPAWMQDENIVNLLGGNPVKGLGTYEVVLKKTMDSSDASENSDINETILNKWKENSKAKNDVTYKMALAGFFMKGNKNDFAKTKKCYLEAKNLYLQAAKLNSIEANLCLGYIYSLGLTQKNDYKPKKAKKIFKNVASKTSATNELIAGMAMRNIATLFHNSAIEPSLLERFKNISVRDKKQLNLKKAEKWYKRSSDKNDSKSAYNLGLLYEGYDGFKENKGEAEDWFRKAVNFNKNNLHAKAKLGRILINKGDTDEHKRNEGIEMLKEAAEDGLVMGQVFLGRAYEEGIITEGKAKDYKKAVKFYSKAAWQNRGYYSHVAQYRLVELKTKIHIENIDAINELYTKELDYGYIESEEKLKKFFL